MHARGDDVRPQAAHVMQSGRKTCRSIRLSRQEGERSLLPVSQSPASSVEGVGEAACPTCARPVSARKSNSMLKAQLSRLRCGAWWPGAEAGFVALRIWQGVRHGSTGERPRPDAAPEARRAREELAGGGARCGAAASRGTPGTRSLIGEPRRGDRGRPSSSVLPLAEPRRTVRPPAWCTFVPDR